MKRSSQNKKRGEPRMEQTPKGELARLVRDKFHGMGAMLGFKLRVVKRTGRSILSNFPQTRTWSVEELSVSHVIRGGGVTRLYEREHSI